MKICILLSSYEGIGSLMEEFDAYQNPGIYVKSHQFEQRIVTKQNAKENIDRIINENFDYIWNFMWGPVDENIAGVNEIKYLESMNVPMIGTSSKFLSLTKLDYKRAISSVKIKTPKGITISGDEESINNLDLGDLKFPLIVKPSVGCGSEFLTADSVCHDNFQLLTQIKILKSKVQYEVMIEEFIEGEEVAVMILETKDGVIALEPLVYEFPKDWKSTQKFLDFDLKFKGIQDGKVTYKIYDENQDLVNEIKETGVKAYESLGVLGSGYARVDFRLKGSELYVLEVNPTPAFFSEIGNTFGDDFIIESTFPGGHECLVETIISSKIRFDTVIEEYNKMASSYDSEIVKNYGQQHISNLNFLIKSFDFGGIVLDLGCGTGLIGKLIKEKYESKLIGIDLSPKMIQLAQDYEKVHIGLIENVFFDLDSTYNHIISAGALLFVDKRYFKKIFSHMFSMATNSISLILEDITEEYKSLCVTNNNMATIFNHLDTIENFQIPTAWSLVCKKREYLFESPLTGLKISGLVLRYEKKCN